MNDQTPLLHMLNIELPDTAPRVRITAGVGSATQKTWNLRRPVTLIGSRRPAHIALHDRDISPAHCVIVNTGTEVLLKDLHTHGGTRCKGADVDLIVLEDGDVITIGANTIQVAVQVPDDVTDDSGCGMEFADPTAFPSPVAVGLLHTDQHWSVQDAVTLIGRHEEAPVFLDHELVSRRHAILFRFNNGPAVFDLGGRDGILVNGRPCSIALLGDGDRITIGPFALLIGSVEGAEPDARAEERERAEISADGTRLAAARDDWRESQPGPSTAPPPGTGRDGSDDAREITSELEMIGNNVAESWEHLNSWQTRLLDEATALSKQETDLTARAAELEARDAALRGQLHDLTRLQEQLKEQERTLSARRAELTAEQEELSKAQARCAEREAQVARRAEELSRREHVFAQRWSRLHAATCPHCGKPIGSSN